MGKIHDTALSFVDFLIMSLLCLNDNDSLFYSLKSDLRKLDVHLALC